MYCNKCGHISPDGAPYCANCGASVNQPRETVGMVEATRLFFTRYTDFQGRSRRSEYWWAYLSILILTTIATVIHGGLATIFQLVTIVPSIAIAVRRLHDIGKSGWWYLILCIPAVGVILMLVWMCTDSTADNQWGPNPKH